MSGRAGIDFGTSNTVIAVWDAKRAEGVPLHVPDYGKSITYRHGAKVTEQISVIPSIIHYDENNRRWIGKQVLDRDLYESDRTFRWMKRYIARRSPIKIRLNGREVSHSEAGREFLTAVLTFAAQELGLQESEEVGLTVPVEAFEDYENWLVGVAEDAGIPRFRLLDEPSAAALGYGVHLEAGEVYLIFDFGGGTLDVSVVLIEPFDPDKAGRRCRVLGKAGADLGGATIDQWLFQEVLRQNDRQDSDDAIRPLSRALLVECERVKERLSFQDSTAVSVQDESLGVVLKAQFTRTSFENLLEEREMFRLLDHTIRRALNASREKGYDEESVRAVLLVGGSSMIPAVQRSVQRFFGKERVQLHRPLDAVARGAAAFVAGVDFQDYIQHDYAIRFFDPRKEDYGYRPLVSRGTSYPTRDACARLTVKASHEGQNELGLAIFELGEQRPKTESMGVELVFDPSGAARVSYLSPAEEESRAYFWVNENNPTFLRADPPAKQGEPRFEVEFQIDNNKRLLVTARDIKTNRVTFRNHPVVQLT